MRTLPEAISSGCSTEVNKPQVKLMTYPVSCCFFLHLQAPPFGESKLPSEDDFFL